MFYKFHSKSPWLKRVLVPLWAFQLVFMLSLITVLIWFRDFSGIRKINIVILLISAVCTVLSVTEVILFAATRLYPLIYLILQLVKTIIWLVPFALTTEEAQWYNFVGTLVLFVTFLAALIYASVVYYRHRRAKARFLHSFQGTDLFPVIADEEANPVGSHRILRAPRNSIKETGPGAEIKYPAEVEEAVEVTVLRELGGDWEVYELPATRSVRSSKGRKSLRSLKGSR